MINLSTLTYVQCINPECKALGCRKTKDHLNGSFCKLCGMKMDEITSNDYEFKLHYTKTIHEEGLLSSRLLGEEEQKWRSTILLTCKFAKPIHGGTMCKRDGVTEYCRFDRCPMKNK